jgi:hypothetical protein
MRYFILMMLVANVAFADVYMLYEKSGGRIYSLSEADDAVQPKDADKVVLKDKHISDLGLTYSQDFYLYKDGRIKVDSRKLEESAKAEIQAREIADEEKRINGEIRAIAIERIKARNENLPHTDGGK